MKVEKNTILIVDTSSNKEVIVGLEIDGAEDILKQPLDKQKAQAVLTMIEKLLKKHKLQLKEITKIKVNPGPGSFTGLRVGISIANALGMMLKIPINEKKVGEIIEPKYN